jgi:hypothetical protein
MSQSSLSVLAKWGYLIYFSALTESDVNTMFKSYKQLTSLPFLIGLLLLLANDFILKDYFHNYFTGKLSDFCGLFVFAIFWSTLLPKARGVIFFATAFLFIVWKGPYSQSFINLFSETLFPIHRVVDLSDLMALLILPFAWKQLDNHPKQTFLSPLLTAALAIFSFCATSVGVRIQRFEQPQYVLLENSTLASDTIQNAEGYGEFAYHKLGDLIAIEVKSMEADKIPAKNDDFQKNLILRDLDDRVIREVNARGQHTIRKPIGEHKFVVETNGILDSLNFYGSRLHGKFTRLDSTGKILIKGYYKKGIEDSVWIFTDPVSNIVTKIIFENGEAISSEKYKQNKLISKQYIATRAETVSNKYFQIALFLTLIIGILILIIRNYRLTYPTAVSFMLWEKLCYPTFLPLAVCLVVYIFSACIPDTYSPPFKVLTDFILSLVTFPLFLLVFFVIKIRRRVDILWYVLLFALFLIAVQEFNQLDRLTEMP